MAYRRDRTPSAHATAVGKFAAIFRSPRDWLRPFQMVSRARGALYLSSHTSAKRQLLKTLLTTRLRPLTRGRQQVATRV
jgi:hypothetical protein